MKLLPVILASGLGLVAAPTGRAAPLQTWTFEGTIEDFNDFNVLQGSNDFVLEVFVDPDTPDLSPGGTAGFFNATASLTLGVIQETFPVEIGIDPNGVLGDNLAISFQGARAPRPEGWALWSFSLNVQDTTNEVFVTGDLPTRPLTLDDFDQSHGGFFAIREDQNASLLGTLVVTDLLTPEPTSLALLGLGTLTLTARRPRK